MTKAAIEKMNAPLPGADSSRVQQKASDPVRSVWVSASAGSGKTKVLTDRVLRLLLAGSPPSRILCITYTKAAAAEMQARLQKRLRDWAVLPDAQLKANLSELIGREPAASLMQTARQLFATLLESSPPLRIQTIHALCQSLLARFPLEAGVAPYFSVMDERTAAELLDEAKLRLLADDSAALREAIATISRDSGEWGFTELMRAVMKKRRAFERLRRAPGGMARAVEKLYEALGVEKSSGFGVRSSEIFSEKLRHRLIEVAELLQEGTQTDQLKAATLREVAAADPLTAEHIEAYFGVFLDKDGQSPKQRPVTQALAKLYPGVEVWMREEAERLAALRERQLASACAESSGAVLRLADALLNAYAALKQRRGVLDYDDLILRARDLLRTERMASWVLYKLDGGIDHVLLDEAQDTSPEQWELTEALVDEFFAGKGQHETLPTLFVVGDEKQSIYRFQGADPAGFARMREVFARRAPDLATLGLHVSFRSTPAVLALVDATFAEVGVRHAAHRHAAPGHVELWPILKMEKDMEEAEAWPLPDTQRLPDTPALRLAALLAETIAAWLREKRPLKARGRAVRPGDIMVLVRRRSALIYHLSAQLKRRGVPVAGLDRMLLTEHIAVEDMLALGNFLLLPEDDLTLAALLKSPLYNMSEEMLFALCHERGEASLWSRVYGYEGDDTACHAAKQELTKLLAKTDFVSPFDLYSDVLHARGGLTRFLARMGEEARDPLEAFLAETLAYEQAHTPTLQGFLHWMGEGEVEITRDMEHAADAVRIMTVHGAKGLEAPIVILPDTTVMPRLDETLYAHDGAVLFCPRKEAASALLRELRAGETATLREEYRRLLYVALTRAKDELYVCGAEGKQRRSEGCWYDLVEAGFGRLEGVARVPFAACYPNVAAGNLLAGGEILTYRNPGEEIEKDKEINASVDIPPLPEALRAALPPEASPGKTLAPSHLLEEVAAPRRADAPLLDAAMARGTLMHRLFHLLSDVEDAKRPTVAARYLDAYAAAWPPEERAAAAREVLNVMRHPVFAPIFGEHALAEAPIAGRTDENTVLSGQIDRLVVTEHDVLIVDFKTGARPPVIPAAYRRQMEAYRALISRIYPRRNVRAALLFTAEPALVPMEDTGVAQKP